MSLHVCELDLLVFFSMICWFPRVHIIWSSWWNSWITSYFHICQLVIYACERRCVSEKMPFRRTFWGVICIRVHIYKGKRRVKILGYCSSNISGSPSSRRNYLNRSPRFTLSCSQWAYFLICDFYLVCVQGQITYKILSEFILIVLIWSTSLTRRLYYSHQHITAKSTI